MKSLFSLLAIISLGFSINANAVSINLIANQNTINLGDNVEVQARISGLNANTALGVYDLSINYDANLFSLSNIIWGDSVIGNQLDLLGFGSLQDSSSGAGWFNAFELSFDDAFDLELLQANEFTLFSLVFNNIASGSGLFSITNTLLGDAYGDELFIASANSTKVTTNKVSVPEPSSLLLLLGIIALVLVRTRMTQSQK
jgi:hypothetical protein